MVSEGSWATLSRTDSDLDESGPSHQRLSQVMFESEGQRCRRSGSVGLSASSAPSETSEEEKFGSISKCFSQSVFHVS